MSDKKVLEGELLVPNKIVKTGGKALSRLTLVVDIIETVKSLLETYSREKEETKRFCHQLNSQLSLAREETRRFEIEFEKEVKRLRLKEKELELIDRQLRLAWENLEQLGRMIMSNEVNEIDKKELIAFYRDNMNLICNILIKLGGEK